MIETKDQYIRTQESRWAFYATLEDFRYEMQANPPADLAMAKIQEEAMLSQIADLENELQEFEAKHGHWTLAEKPR